MNKKEKKELKKILNEKSKKMQKLEFFVKENKIRYRFYKAIKDIEVYFADQKELICTIKKGTNLIGVGYGVATPEFKKEIMYFTDINELKHNGAVEFINDPVESLKIAQEFKPLIDEIEIHLTGQFLTHINMYEDFIRIPEKIKENTKLQIERMLI